MNLKEQVRLVTESLKNDSDKIKVVKHKHLPVKLCYYENNTYKSFSEKLICGVVVDVNNMLVTRRLPIAKVVTSNYIKDIEYTTQVEVVSFDGHDNKHEIIVTRYGTELIFHTPTQFIYTNTNQVTNILRSRGLLEQIKGGFSYIFYVSDQEYECFLDKGEKSGYFGFKLFFMIKNSDGKVLKNSKINNYYKVDAQYNFDSTNKLETVLRYRPSSIKSRLLLYRPSSSGEVQIFKIEY
jgi:hypothetical protein